MSSDFCVHRLRVARVPHVCVECFETINPGIEYCYVSGVWDGRGQSFKQCVRCHLLGEALFSWNWKTNDKGYADEGIIFGELLLEVIDCMLDWGFNWPVPLAMPERVASRLVSNQEL